MAKQKSAGLLMYRIKEAEPEFFLVHPGGPFFKNKDKGYWTIPKGEIEEGEDLLKAAIREFTEETGITPRGDFLGLGQVKQKNGKTVYCWAFEGEWDEKNGFNSNTFPLEWPRRSGKTIQVPEVDKAAWMKYREAKIKINTSQAEFIDKLIVTCHSSRGE